MNNSQQVADTADLIFITTPDGAIEQVASQIKWAHGKSVVHCSGADSTAILEKARKDGAIVGVFHPLQTFADITQAIENIPGTTFAIEAEEPLLTTLKEMAVSLGGSWIQLKAEDKAAYHAAAVFASNYLVTLVKMATDLWQTFDIPPDQAVKALLPLNTRHPSQYRNHRFTAMSHRPHRAGRYRNHTQTSRSKLVKKPRNYSPLIKN